MNQRERIFSALRAAVPAPLPRPEVIHPVTESVNLIADFEQRIRAAGGSCEVVNAEEASTRCQELAAAGSSFIASRYHEHRDLGQRQRPQDWSDLAVCGLDAAFGVAENGAVWIDCTPLPAPAMPFLCQTLILTVPAADIVASMHQAYARLDALPSYGVFISGPSKTADVEQCLVIGAHGAKQLVCLVVT